MRTSLTRFFLGRGRGLTRFFLGLAAATLACHPSVAVQKSAIGAAASNEDERHKLFEATLQMLDEHPEYVDELFAQLRRHPASRDQFLLLAPRGGKDPKLAQLIAGELVKTPEAVTTISTALIDDVYTRPEAEAAFLAAVRARKQEMSEMLVRDPKSLAELTAAIAAAAPREVGAAIREKVKGEPEERPAVAPKK